MSLEQICRELLQRAIDDGIVTFNRDAFVSTKNVMELSAGDLVGVSNLLSELLSVEGIEHGKV